MSPQGHRWTIPCQSLMRLSVSFPSFGFGLAMTCMALVGAAQDPTGSQAPTVDAAAGVTAPKPKTHPDPVYPPDALRDRIAGVVGVELTIDETGRVVGARLVQSAGHGFDEAAIEAVRQWTFEPARNGDTPVKSVVELTIPF